MSVVSHQRRNQWLALCGGFTDILAASGYILYHGSQEQDSLSSLDGVMTLYHVFNLNFSLVSKCVVSSSVGDPRQEF